MAGQDVDYCINISAINKTCYMKLQIKTPYNNFANQTGRLSKSGGWGEFSRSKVRFLFLELAAGEKEQTQ